MNKYQRRINKIKSYLPNLKKEKIIILAEDNNYKKFQIAIEIGKEATRRIALRNILKEGGNNESKS